MDTPPKMVLWSKATRQGPRYGCRGLILDAATMLACDNLLTSRCVLVATPSSAGVGLVAGGAASSVGTPLGWRAGSVNSALLFHLNKVAASGCNLGLIFGDLLGLHS